MFRRRPTTSSAGNHRVTRPNHKPAVQGTQAAAAAQMESNKKYFKYPAEGFVSPIEHSLIHAMISEPAIYPPDVIRQAIREQDFSEFLVVKRNTKNTTAASTANDEEEICSYAQLSALLSLGMQKWPDATASNNEKENPNDSVAQTLCQALLRTVVQYANDHDLDREHEIAEFLNPAVERTKQRLDRAANVKMNLPLYAGLALSVGK